MIGISEADDQNNRDLAVLSNVDRQKQARTRNEGIHPLPKLNQLTFVEASGIGIAAR